MYTWFNANEIKITSIPILYTELDYTWVCTQNHWFVTVSMVSDNTKVVHAFFYKNKEAANSPKN